MGSQRPRTGPAWALRSTSRSWASQCSVHASGENALGLTVTLRLHAELARYAPAETRGAVTLRLPAGARVADALVRLNLPPRRRIIVGLNGQSAEHDTPLHDGDHLDLVTPMSGGAPY